MAFEFRYDDEAITLSVRPERQGFLQKLVSRQKPADIEQMTTTDKELMFAVADLRFIADQHQGGLEVTADTIRMSHDIAADLSADSAAALGLPPLVDMVFHSDVEAVPGQPNFRLRHEWHRFGKREITSRTGAFLKTSEGLRRIPRWLLDAVKVSEDFKPGSDLHSHWEALARFRQALDPNFEEGADSASAQMEMSDFLRRLHVQVADGFSIMPKGSESNLDFDVVPFSRRSLAEENEEAEGEVSVTMSELAGGPLREFQARVRDRGALSAYRVGSGRFLVIDRSAKPALRVMAEMQHAPDEEKRTFIKNPRQKITEAIEQDLRDRGILDGLSDAQQAEMIETIAFPTFIETKEYSERVLGKTVYAGPSVAFQEGSGTTWLPEVFGEAVARLIKGLPIEELEVIEQKIQQAIQNGEESIEHGGEHIAATPTTERAVRRQIQTLIEEENGKSNGEDQTPPAPEPKAPVSGPIILEVKENLEQVKWRARVEPRQAVIPVVLPTNIVTPLKGHQVESFKWQVDAWKSGLPGILNADEQGLGKTLQTISFLAWLKAQMASESSKQKGPILIVAPTSLLENWEQEVERHLAPGGLGDLTRLYGSGVSAIRHRGAFGRDTLDGEEHLNLTTLHKAIAAGRGHEHWVLTTYTTLTNYQHSLGKVAFSAVVFDEIQALKNPGSLRAIAGMAMNADFRIGLTGTPIENSTTDLWAILEQLAPGRLVPLNDFRKLYNTPDEGKLRLLYDFVFTPTDGLPAMALRRLKEAVAKELPSKTRRLHPRVMPDEQAEAYEKARDKLATGTKGAALKMLHHIRSVSVHPAITAIEDADAFIGLSGRLKACFEIIDSIHARQERVLVFIEHIQMQFRFIELLKARYGMRHVDLINGSTPIHKRQDIVNRFQRHLTNDEGFDVLVLGPKAAGTGLTLTAATHVIHLSRWWNPAVEEQCNDRVHRIGQTKEVTIHIPMAIHGDFREKSFDCLLHSLMTRKRKLASSALWPMGDTEADAEQLQKMLAEEVRSADAGDPVHSAILRTFERDQVTPPEQGPDRSYYYS